MHHLKIMSLQGNESNEIKSFKEIGVVGIFSSNLFLTSQVTGVTSRDQLLS